MCHFRMKINKRRTRHVVALELISSMNVWDSGLVASSSSNDNARVISENTNKMWE